MTQYVAIDVETTGLEAGSRLLSLAAILFDPAGDGMLDVFERRVNPGMPIPPDVTKINGISDADAAGAADANRVLMDLVDWLPVDPMLVAHNAPFDVGVLAWEAGRHGVDVPDFRVYDTLLLARILKETGRSNGLQAIIEHYKLERLGEAHRALADADACRRYFALQHALGNTSLVPTNPWSTVAGAYSYAPPEALPESLRSLPDLVAAGSPLTIVYEDAKGERTERTVTPYGWADTPKGIVFHGRCHLRDERRTFYAERVREVSTNETGTTTDTAAA